MSLYKKILKFLDYPHKSEKQHIKFDKGGDYLFVPEIHSAKKHMYFETISLIIVLIFLFLCFDLFFLYFFHFSIFITTSAVISLFYIILIAFKLVVVFKSFKNPFIKISDEEIKGLSKTDLPIYTIIIPLYREEEVIKQIVKAMSEIDYPKDKLEIIITLEKNDEPTINVILSENLPRYFRTIILPNTSPKTKSKALNVAFLEAKGEYIVIYDAEIIPDKDQLKKAYIAFQKYPRIDCFQTRLDHYNALQNIITKLFNAEFSFYYDLFLPGLLKMGYPIPISGHSAHFKTSVLRNIGAWDPYNVTEDCDIGIRLARKGYKTDIIDSFSMEEATADLDSWLNQRTRWMKGFIQTSIVHLRHPFRLKNEVGGWGNMFGFLFTVPGTVIANFFSIFYWLFLPIWFITGLNIIKIFFTKPIFYVSMTSFIVGVIVFSFLNMVSVYRRKRYSIVIYCVLSPLYWIMLSVATLKAFIEFFTKPYFWGKTDHGKYIKDK